MDLTVQCFAATVQSRAVQACRMGCGSSCLCFLELRFVSAGLLLWDECETLSAEIIELLAGELYS